MIVAGEDENGNELTECTDSSISKYHLELNFERKNFFIKDLKCVYCKLKTPDFSHIMILVMEIRQSTLAFCDWEFDKPSSLRLMILCNYDVVAEKHNLCGSQFYSPNNWKKILISSPICTINGFRQNCPFDAVPDDVLIEIFSRIKDAENRMRCKLGVCE